MDETSELSQMVQLVMDDLMSPQHEGDMMSNNKPILMTKKDLRADQIMYEESPSRKRGRPKKEKIEEKKPNGKPKMVKENTQPKSAVETKSDSNKKSAGTNLNGAVKKIRYNPEYPITKILAMYVYRKKNNMQRIYFVEWEEDNETHSGWVISENTEAQELVANFIEECSIRSALDAFLGAPVMSHVAQLLQNNDEAISVMQSMGKQPEEMAAEDDYFVFAKKAKKEMKKRAIETIDEFVKFIRRKASNA
ncbi:hypothetical protein niasHS_007016 [Heterodera schachtii]|uniref:Chromo domain-containing protein n=1 Tax=Heterodera schachtii TaxID=97005 RepID=A0ABD2JFA6_HETSC